MFWFSYKESWVHSAIFLYQKQYFKERVLGQPQDVYAYHFKDNRLCS